MARQQKFTPHGTSIKDQLTIKLDMGLIDRAFGSDKNSMLFKSLAMHWRAVSSHYENFIANNELSATQAQVMREIQATSAGIANRVIGSIKGFGITSPDLPTMNRDLEQIMKLHAQIESATDKQKWLPEVVWATRDILDGNKRNYLNRQYWFSE